MTEQALTDFLIAVALILAGYLFYLQCRMNNTHWKMIKLVEEKADINHKILKILTKKIKKGKKVNKEIGESKQ